MFLTYDLPPERIAQTPVEPRDAARLLCLPAGGGAPVHRIFRELPELLSPDDVLVVNETRVSALRLFGRRPTGATVEFLLLHPAPAYGPTAFEALVRPGRRLRPGDRVEFDAGLRAEVIGSAAGGGRFVRFDGEPEETLAALERWGKVPLPPYITAPLADRERYQTVYARLPGSAAAPTAGLHFTPALLERIAQRGVPIVRVRLDVGLGTFRPIRGDDITQHEIHHEAVAVSAEATERVNACRGRVIAVGTTAVRALETAARAAPVGRRVQEIEGETDLWITPGFRFRAVDALITNFHQPRSTLLLLVAAFVGEEALRGAYAEALAQGYRFLSFGDAMFIERGIEERRAWSG